MKSLWLRFLIGGIEQKKLSQQLFTERDLCCCQNHWGHLPFQLRILKEHYRFSLYLMDTLGTRFKTLPDGIFSPTIFSYICWWMSEKMDGVRAYWNGRQSFSRQGKSIWTPVWFTAALNVQLDGELWLGAGTSFLDVNKILQNEDEWHKLKYYVFDIPSSLGTYEERMVEMQLLKREFPAHVHVVDSIQCKGTQHLAEYLGTVLSHKGEGVMIRKSNSVYEKGMTTTILKVKVKYSSRTITNTEIWRHWSGSSRSGGLWTLLSTVIIYTLSKRKDQPDKLVL